MYTIKKNQLVILFCINEKKNQRNKPIEQIHLTGLIVSTTNLIAAILREIIFPSANVPSNVRIKFKKKTTHKMNKENKKKII